MTVGEAVDTTLRAYPVYKESGVPWIGEIPEGWEVQPVRRGFDVIGGTTPESGNESFWDGDQLWATPEDISKIEGKTLSDTRRKITHAAIDQTTLTKVQKGVVLLTTRAPIGNLALTAEPMTFNQGCKALIPRAHLDADFSYYAIKAATPILKAFGKGTTFMELSAGALKAFSVPVPPFPEQQVIATFLDRETVRINELLLEHEGLLDDLVVKRQATVVQAVFKGLAEGKVSEKDSGVPSLGEIPQHWEVSPLKRILLSLEQGWSPECENRNADAGEWGVLKLSSVTGGIFKAEENKALPTHLEPLPGLSLRKGDILVTRANTRALVGAAAMVEDDFNELMISDLIYRLRVDQDRCLPAYLTWILQSPVGRSVIELNANGTSHSMVKIPRGVLNNMIIPLPPLAEQHAITEHLDQVLAQLDQLVSEVRASMELMRQHRSALITAAVTGKIDVRQTDVPLPAGTG